MTTLLCIVCPASCRIEAELRDGEVIAAGQGCPRGLAFAASELQNPTRSLTTTVRTIFPHQSVLPVRTDGEIPKGRLREAIALLGNVLITRPLRCGDTVLEDLMGCRIIATASVEPPPDPAPPPAGADNTGK